MDFAKHVAQRRSQRQCVRYVALPEGEYLDLISSGQASMDFRLLNAECGGDVAAAVSMLNEFAQSGDGNVAVIEDGVDEENFACEYDESLRAELERTREHFGRLTILVQQTHDSNSL